MYGYAMPRRQQLFSTSHSFPLCFMSTQYYVLWVIVYWLLSLFCREAVSTSGYLRWKESATRCGKWIQRYSTFHRSQWWNKLTNNDDSACFSFIERKDETDVPTRVIDRTMSILFLRKDKTSSTTMIVHSVYELVANRLSIPKPKTKELN